MCATEQAHIEEDITTPRRDSSLSAWVNVIYGCNEKCTYCVVPYTRGTEQSRRPEDVKREMLALGEAGAAAHACVHVRVCAHVPLAWCVGRMGLWVGVQARSTHCIPSAKAPLHNSAPTPIPTQATRR